MDEIVKRLHEKKQIELAKSILEDNGYKVNKRVNESASQVRNVLNDLGIRYNTISEEDGVVYVEGDKPYGPEILKKVHNALPSAESSGFEKGSMWFAFPDDI